MGCDLSLESAWDEDRNDVTFVCLTCFWQPVGSLSVQMFAKSENTKCSPLVESMGCDLSLESSWNEDCNDVTFVCLTCCWQPVGSLLYILYFSDIDSSGSWSGSVYCQSAGSGSRSVYRIYGSATLILMKGHNPYIPLMLQIFCVFRFCKNLCTDVADRLSSRC